VREDVALRRRYASAMGARILLVEDDRETRRLVESLLSDDGYAVDAVGRRATATAAARTATYDAVVLDLGLPDGDGIELCREWRRAGVTTPILVVTARADVASRVRGLDAGADDYVGKPFAVAELRARLRAVLRRGPSRSREQVFRRDGLTVDFSRRRASLGGCEVPLTRRELEVFARLVRAGGRAVARDDLLEEIWGEATPEAGASLEVIVGRLRRKLGPNGGETLIRTFRGHGYGLATPDEA